LSRREILLYVQPKPLQCGTAYVFSINLGEAAIEWGGYLSDYEKRLLQYSYMVTRFTLFKYTIIANPVKLNLGYKLK